MTGCIESMIVSLLLHGTHSATTNADGGRRSPWTARDDVVAMAVSRQGTDLSQDRSALSLPPGRRREVAHCEHPRWLGGLRPTMNEPPMLADQLSQSNLPDWLRSDANDRLHALAAKSREWDAQ